MTIGKFYLVTPLLANSYPNEVLKAELILGGEGPNAVLCKTCSLLVCVLEQPRVEKSSAGPNW